MKILSMMLVVAVSMVACGCGGDSVANPAAVDDWTFPANSSKFAATLYSTSSTVAVNGTSDVRLVLYNVSSLFGAAFEISVPQDSLEVTEVLQGRVFGTTSDAIVVSQIEPAKKRVSYGITLKAGSTASFTGSNVILKMKVKGKIAGPVNVRVNPVNLELKTSGGQPITNVTNIAVEDILLTVQ
jgi:hypothetical protein